MANCCKTTRIPLFTWADLPCLLCCMDSFLLSFSSRPNLASIPCSKVSFPSSRSFLPLDFPLSLNGDLCIFLYCNSFYFLKPSVLCHTNQLLSMSQRQWLPIFLFTVQSVSLSFGHTGGLSLFRPEYTGQLCFKAVWSGLFPSVTWKLENSKSLPVLYLLHL